MITRCYLEITNICNLDCLFCPKTERKLGKLTAEQYDAILKKISGEVKFLAVSPFSVAQIPFGNSS